MLYPTSYLKSKRFGKVCARITDGRFSGGSWVLSIGYIPEGAEARLMALAEDGDKVKIDIPSIAVGCTTNQPGLIATGTTAAHARALLA